jgi:hypothetical protein
MLGRLGVDLGNAFIIMSKVSVLLSFETWGWLLTILKFYFLLCDRVL